VYFVFDEDEFSRMREAHRGVFCFDAWRSISFVSLRHCCQAVGVSSVGSASSKNCPCATRTSRRKTAYAPREHLVEKLPMRHMNTASKNCPCRRNCEEPQRRNPCPGCIVRPASLPIPRRTCEPHRDLRDLHHESATMRAKARNGGPPVRGVPHCERGHDHEPASVGDAGTHQSVLRDVNVGTPKYGCAIPHGC